MDVDIHKEIKEKCKTKNNGVFSHKKNFYIAFNNQLAGYCDYFGNVIECVYGFNVSKGKAKDRFDGRDVLKKYLKSLIGKKGGDK